ncbi:MAG: cell envelope integrity protein CreD [Myxococcota bacterium]
MQSTAAFASLRSNQSLRLLVLSFLALLLLIPIGMVRDVIFDRAARRDEAVREVAASWGGAQRIAGPRLVVPFVVRWQDTLEDGKKIERERRDVAVFLPDTLDVTGTLETKTLERGIFEVPVYHAKVALSGVFAAPDFTPLGVVPSEVLWHRAEIVIDLSEVRAIDEITLDWGGARLAFEPGGGRSMPSTSAIHVPLGARASAGAKFAVALAARGSESLAIAPLGERTTAKLESSWPSPSFSGEWLPADRSVSEQGFSARWTVAALGRGFPQSWLAADEPVRTAARASQQSDREDYTVVTESPADPTTFGVRLLTPVDSYRMAERSAKYAVLFIALTFATLWLFEVLAKTPLHSVQYLLVGAALCLFFLLELSLAEHLGFGLAYALASGGIVGLIGGYAWAVLRSFGRAGVVAGIVTTLYAYLFVLLTNADYALLAGALGLFAALAAVMWLTRSVDWRDVGGKDKAAPGST